MKARCPKCKSVFSLSKVRIDDYKTFCPYCGWALKLTSQAKEMLELMDEQEGEDE